MTKVRLKYSGSVEGAGWYYRRSVAGRRWPWRGPRYLLRRNAHRDLNMLLNELTALVKVNAPLVQGMEAAAAERRRGMNVDWKQILKKVLLFLLLLLFLLALSPLMVTLMESVYESDQDLSALLALIPLAVIATLFLREFGFRGAKSEAVFLALRDQLQQGKQLSEGLATLTNIVPPYVIDITAAGENSGDLHTALVGVRDRLLEMTRSRERISLTLLYGMMMLWVGGSIMTFLMMKVLPVFEEIYEEFSAQFTSQAPERFLKLITVGDWLVYNSAYLLQLGGLMFLLVALMALLKFYDHQRRAILLLESPLYHLPIVKRAMLQASLAPVCEVLAMLLRAGVPLPHALQQAEHLHVHPHLLRALRRLREQVEMGESMAAAARKQRNQFPASFASMVALGEQSGMLPDALAYLAGLYTDNTLTRQRILGQLLLPAMVLVLGSIVLFVEMAVYEMVWGLGDVIFYSL